MKVHVLGIGRAGRLLAPAIREYEGRARRYWRFEAMEVPAVKATGNRSTREVVALEAKRLVRHVPPDTILVALTRTGTSWDSVRLARFLEGLAVEGRSGACFVIGGAAGLGSEVLDAAEHRLALSSLTLPHDLARLVILEQLYRAGTILRGEPYHKMGDDS